MGMLYLVQPANLLNTFTYKIGMSKNLTMSRINSYGAKTKIHRVASVDDVVETEKKLIAEFEENFKLHKGKEYFTGDLKEMIR